MGGSTRLRAVRPDNEWQSRNGDALLAAPMVGRPSSFLAAVRRSCPRILCARCTKLPEFKGTDGVTKADLESIVDRDINKLSNG